MPVRSVMHAQAACFGRLYINSNAPLSYTQGSSSCCALIVFMVDNLKLIPEARVYLNGILSHLHAALRSRVLLLNIFIPIARPCSDILLHLRPLHDQDMQNELECWSLDFDKHVCTFYSILPDVAFRSQPSSEHTYCKHANSPDAAIVLLVLLSGHVADIRLKTANLLETCRCSVMAPLCCSCAVNTILPALPSVCESARCPECF